MEKRKKKEMNVGDRTFNIRLDEESLKLLQDMAKELSTDKSSLARMAIEQYLEEFDDQAFDDDIESYLNLRIGDEEFAKNFDKDKIPQEFKEARKKSLEEIRTKSMKKRGK